ncbi:MAG: hypothetical protein HPY76_13295 [Anaerolineae bacterium]|nr:hypothetical protein [Anaerolineae bacterium]
MPADRLARVERVRRIHSSRLMRLANVVGVGVGLRHRKGEVLDEVVLVVLVSEKVPVEKLAAGDRIPAEIEGVPVDVVGVGEIGADG